MRDLKKPLSLLLAALLCCSAAFFAVHRLPAASVWAEGEIGDETTTLAEDPTEPTDPTDPTEPTTEHVHAFGAWTPDGSGNHTRACACGETETKACTFEGNYVSNGGTHSRDCTVCGWTKTEACAYEKTVVAPTMTAEGYTLNVCPTCGDTFKDDRKPAEIDRAESTPMGDIDRDGAFTAAEARTILRASLSLDALTPEELAYADIDADGKLTAADARLSLRLSVGLDSVSARHAYTYETGAAATCTATGTLTLTCAYCGDKRELTVPASPHEFGEPVVTPATCTANGSKVYTCINCGMQRTDTLFAIPHDYSVAATAAHGVLCAACGATQPGWTAFGGNWYYYNANGTRLVGKQFVDGQRYRFDANGVSETGREPAPPKVAVLGDSLVVSLESAGVAPYDFYGKVSLHINTIWTKSVSGSSRTIPDEVIGRDYDCVVLLIGINDLDYAGSVWEQWYREALQGLKERAPGATVYAHAIFPVNETRARANGYVATNAAVRAKNALIKQAAEEEGVPYLDPASVFTDASGQLPYEAASDGIHFGFTYAGYWYDWIKGRLK